jgi:hypothetical protein
MNDRTDPAATTTKTWDMTLDYVLGVAEQRVLANIREATTKHYHPRSPGELDMLDILDGLLVNGHNVHVLGMCGFHVGGSGFGVHGC